MKNRLIVRLLLTAFILVFINCAKRSSPTGGEKDITPPGVSSSTPANESVNFNGKRIRIYFDEYIKLKDLQKQLIVSPPLEYQPEILPMGSASKSIDIRLKDTLKENTTYVLNFGQSIVDNNEGNPLSFYKYVFSTGDYIDSLKIDGLITDALEKKADQFVSVMLYEVDSTFSDSIIYKQPPKYITNTLDSATTFQLTNLKAGKYLMIGMKDKANNYVFNQKTDKIAFLKDYITVPSDSVFQLNLFKEVTDFRASQPSLAAKNKIIFGYEGNPDKMKIDLLSEKPDDYRYRITRDLKKDTLYYWFTPYEADSLMFRVSNEKKIDTFKVRIKELYKDSLTLNATQTGILSFKTPFGIEANTPIEKFDRTKVSIQNKDSVNVDFTEVIDSVKNRVDLQWEVEPSERYEVTLLPDAITDFFGKTNDTLSYKLNTKSLADLGTLRVVLENVKSYPLIVQLTNEKGELKYEIFTDTELQYYDFVNIDPANYLMRIIYDDNGNKKWDTGNFLLREQPEKVIHFPDVVELRANWELEQRFILE